MRDDRPSKPAPRSTGFKSHGGSPDRPARSTGFKSHAGAPKGRDSYAGRDEAPRKPHAEGGAEGRPFEKREGSKPYAGKSAAAKSGDAKPAYSKGAPRAAGSKPFGAKPDAGKGFAPRKPAARPADATDTSKRFTPPKRPRS